MDGFNLSPEILTRCQHQIGLRQAELIASGA